MALKQRINTPQEYLQAGMALFIIAIFVNLIGDGRIGAAFFASLIPDQSLLATIQGIATGFSIPVSCASIFFNVRGLMMMRSKCQV